MKRPISGLLRANANLRREILARQQVEQELRFLAAMVRSTRTAIVCERLDGTVISWNPAARRTYGFSAKEMCGRSLFAIIPPERRAEWRKIMRRIRRGERVEQMETVRRKKNGERIPISLALSPVRDMHGRIVGASAISRDITLRRRAEAQVRRERDLAQKYLEIAEIFFLVVDPRGKVLLLNRKGCRVLGYKPGELLSRDWFDTCVARSDRRKSRAAFRRFLSRKTSQPRYVERLTLTKSGEERLIGWHFTLLRDNADGQAIGVLASGEDLTEKRATEEALRRLSALALRARDEERRSISRELHDSTAQILALLTAQIAQARKSNSLHEFERDRLLDSARSLAHQALQEVRSLSYLLHPPLLEELGLASAMRAYTTGLTRGRDVRVHLDVPARLERFPRHIELTAFRVMQEGLSNALRHSHSRTVHVKVGAGPGALIVQVSDKGRGFRRGMASPLNVSLSRRGMGLLNMKERLGLLGGQLDIRTGKTGTRLRAVIPLSRAGRETIAHPLG